MNLPNVPLLMAGLCLLLGSGASGLWFPPSGKAVRAAVALGGLLGAGLIGLAVGRPDAPPAASPSTAWTAASCEQTLAQRLLALSAGAAAPAPADDTPTAGAIGLVSGTRGGTYHAVGGDLVELARRHGVPAFNRTSNGGLDSLAQLADPKVNAALGFVQADLLDWLKTSADPAHRALALQLRLIAPLYAEEVHVLARRDIRGLDGLQGGRVLTASSSQGSRHTAENLLRARGIVPARWDDRLTLVQAACAVVTGQADALVAVAGRPVRGLQALDVLAETPGTPLAAVHLLPLEPAAGEDGYERADLAPSDYPWLAAPVRTLAVRTVLVAMDFSPNGSAYRRLRCAQLARIGQALRQGLPALKEAPFHPKWREVDWHRRQAGWRADTCSGGLLPPAATARP